MAEVKDKFEKGLVDANKPRTEKRLDVRVNKANSNKLSNHMRVKSILKQI